MANAMRVPTSKPTDKGQQHRNGRPRGPKLTLAKNGEWVARVTREAEGETIRERWRSGTTNLAVAKKRLAKLVAGAAVEAPKVPSFAEAFELASATWDGQASANDKRHLVERWALPTLGGLPVDRVRAVDVRNIVDGVVDAGYAAQTATHVLSAIGGVLKWCWRQELVGENVALRVERPRDRGPRRARAVMADEELATYLAWAHPEPCFQLGVQERQTMVALSRCWGGVRAGDLVALDWRALDSETGAFAWGVAPRQKTRKPQLIAIPELLRPALRAWWHAHGCPSAGPVFPCLKGARAGEVRHGVKLAKALRQDLMRALGVETWTHGRWQRLPEAQWTQRQRELLLGTEDVAPLDFHSMRRAFCAACAAAGINAQTAAKLAGHSNLETHARYLVRGEVLEVPQAVLPRFSANAQPKPEELGGLTVGNHGGKPRLATCTGGEQHTAHAVSSRAPTAGLPVAEQPRTTVNTRSGQPFWPKPLLDFAMVVAASRSVAAFASAHL